MTYKRYLLFTYDQYYPMGAEDDVAGSFDTLEQAQEAATTGQHGWTKEYASVLDLECREFVWSGRISA